MLKILNNMSVDSELRSTGDEENEVVMVSLNLSEDIW